MERGHACNFQRWDWNFKNVLKGIIFWLLELFRPNLIRFYIFAYSFPCIILLQEFHVDQKVKGCSDNKFHMHIYVTCRACGRYICELTGAVVS